MEIDTAVYIQSIEIGENRGPWSVVNIKAWDSSTNRWQSLYSGGVDTAAYELYKATNQYSRFAPPLCQTTFLCSAIRIELDTFTIVDWNELDYVKVIGATELKAGVLTTDVMTQAVSVHYVPDADFFGDDAFTFGGCDCAYDSSRNSEDATVIISVGATNDHPVAEASSVTVDCMPDVADTITLSAYDIDTSSTSLVYSSSRCQMELHSGMQGRALLSPEQHFQRLFQGPRCSSSQASLSTTPPQTSRLALAQPTTTVLSV